MGASLYNTNSRNIRAASMDWMENPDAAFTQQKLQEIHESMSPKNLKVRECRDSEIHPNTVPVILGLDETGSMRGIPKQMVKEGLPTLMSTLIQKGIPDAAVCFLGIGDHESDRAPLQVGQFESGDEELDMWLTRTWLEGNGGGNRGESYHLAWLFASRYTATDAWEKRKQKGFLFTVGDEPVLPNLPGSAINFLLGTTGAENTSAETLLKEAQEKWNVFHIIVMHSGQAKASVEGWRKLLGQNVIEVSDHTKVADTIAEIVLSHTDDYVPGNVTVKKDDGSMVNDNIIL